jgi:hypothetical protein
MALADGAHRPNGVKKLSTRRSWIIALRDGDSLSDAKHPLAGIAVAIENPREAVF